MAQKPSLEVKPSVAICRMCGTAYGKLNGYFYKSYNQVNKGNGYLPVCKHCVDDLYEDFLRECKDPRLACHQICRKFNVYWSDDIYDGVVLGSSTRSVVSGYLTRANVVKYRNKSYEDYMKEIGMMWDIPGDKKSEEELAPPTEKDTEVSESEVIEEESDDDIEVADEIKASWGVGFSNRQYIELEERRLFWVEEMKKRGVDVDDLAVNALLRQIVAQEIDINKGRANGEDVDKRVNTFNTLVSNGILKPSQKKSEVDVSMESNPLGVWIWKYENERPLPEDENESQIIKFIHTWLFGHLGKMLGLRNSYTKLYEDEMERLKVEKPEYAEEDDDTILTDAFGGDVFE